MRANIILALGTAVWECAGITNDSQPEILAETSSTTRNKC